MSVWRGAAGSRPRISRFGLHGLYTIDTEKKGVVYLGMSREYENLPCMIRSRCAILSS